MRKLMYVFLGLLVTVSGCSEHLSDHCIEMSAKVGEPAATRENYHATLTPIGDFVGECYCNVEDAGLIACYVAFVAGFAVVYCMAQSGYSCP